MTGRLDPAVAGMAAELAVRAVDDLMTWELQAVRDDLTVDDVRRIVGQLRSAADALDPDTTIGEPVAADQVPGRRALVLVHGGDR